MSKILNNTLVTRLYYFFGILMGGYRHYSFELNLFQPFAKIDLSEISHFIPLTEYLVICLFLYALFFPLNKRIHLIIYCFLFLLDFLFHNFIAFQSSMIMAHQVPLFCYLFLTFSEDSDNKRLLLLIANLFITAGFMASAVSKIQTGWLSPDNTVTYDYLLQFNKGYEVSHYLSDLFVNIHSIFFWKSIDYLVVTFELSFLVNLVTLRYYKILFAFAMIFHLLILLILNIGIFYPQILFYILIMLYERQQPVPKPEYSPFIKRSFAFCLIGLVVCFYIFRMTPFIIYILPDWFYDHVEFIINIILTVLFVTCFINFGKDGKRQVVYLINNQL